MSGSLEMSSPVTDSQLGPGRKDAFGVGCESGAAGVGLHAMRVEQANKIIQRTPW